MPRGRPTPRRGADARTGAGAAPSATRRAAPRRAGTGRPANPPRAARTAWSRGSGRLLVAPVPAGQPAPCERRERRVAETVGRAERQDLRLVAALEQRVGVLH